MVPLPSPSLRPPPTFRLCHLNAAHFRLPFLIRRGLFNGGGRVLENQSTECNRNARVVRVEREGAGENEGIERKVRIRVGAVSWIASDGKCDIKRGVAKRRSDASATRGNKVYGMEEKVRAEKERGLHKCR